jgi:hypothetical protein
LQVEDGIDNMRDIFVIRALLDHQNREVRMRLGNSSSDDTSRCATWSE